MRKLFLFILFFTRLITLQAQTSDDVYSWASEIVESLSEDDDDHDYSYLIEDLVRIYNNPIDINKASKEDLEQIGFLNSIQIENLLYHIYVNGPLGSIYELQAVEGFDKKILEWLEPLVFFVSDGVKYKTFKPHGDFFLRSRFTVETPAGYNSDGEETPAFKGDKYLLYSRFEASLTKNFEAGFIAEKDPGEPMFNSDISTMDYLSGYVSWKSEKFVKQVIVGQYKISAGEGLVLQSGTSNRKSSMVTSVANKNNSVRPSLSVNESSGLSGILILLGSKKFSVTPFLSVRKRDGSFSVDDNGDSVITGFSTDGYHRTISELSSRKNIRETVYGLQGKYFLKHFTIETGFLEYNINYPLIPADQPYNLYYFRGNHNSNSWLAVDGSIRKVYLFSEIAFNNGLDPALWGGLLFSPGGDASMVISYRRIPVDFKAPFGAPLTESSKSAGETGFYSGLQIGLPAGLSLSAYFDYFKFNWLQYQLKAPSDGYDLLATLTHKSGSKWENSFRFRYREKMVNLSTDEPDYPVGTRCQTQFRVQSRFTPLKQWSFTTRCDYHKVKIPGKSVPSGFYLGQEIRYNHPGNKWNIITRYGIIDVEDYETRIYVYEPDVLYSLTTPAYYGQGSRWIVMGKYTIAKNLDLWARYSWWHYTNRESTGSGNTLIDSNVIREFRFQIRKRF